MIIVCSLSYVQQGRQGTFPTVVAQLKSDHELGSRVIIELGTNGPFSTSQLVSLLKALGPVQQIILVNTRVPRPWQDNVNSILASVAASYPRTTLIDWYAASAGKGSYFYPDGVHLNPTGAKVFASLVTKALGTGLPPSIENTSSHAPLASN